jgi:hypothetical protein
LVEGGNVDLIFRIPEPSEFLTHAARIKNSFADRKPFGDISLRPLSRKEIEELEARAIMPNPGKGSSYPDDFTANCVRSSFFLGDCILGRFAGSKRLLGATVPSGIYSSTLSGSIVGNGALVHRCDLVANCFIDSDAVVSGSVLTHEGRASFGNGIEIRAGIETGGRTLFSYVDLDCWSAEYMARNGAKGRGEVLAKVRAYAEAASLDIGYVGSGASILGARRIENSFIGSGVEVDGADLIRNSTLYGEGKDRVRAGTGVVIEDSVLRPGSEVDSQAIVLRSFVAGPCGSGTAREGDGSYLGPNTKIGEGEVTSSFVGPFVGFHHQSLLIAAFWPEGRGTVGHGANVGSNHTSRTPDQEIWPGEGMFFGLGCNVKFPADFSRSPYTIVATGLTTLPQKLEFPFSLISQPEEIQSGIPPAYNRIIPAWGVSGTTSTPVPQRGKSPRAEQGREPRLRRRSPEARNRGAHEDRGEKARRSGGEQASLSSRRHTGNRQELSPGNRPGDRSGNLRVFHPFRLSQNSRLPAGSLRRTARRQARISRPAIRAQARGAEVRIFPEDHVRVRLGRGRLEDLMEEYIEDLDFVARKVFESRAKDFRRGVNVVPDYTLNHQSPDADELVEKIRKTAKAEAERLRQRIGEVP